jgi:hypothetical protein
MRAGGEPRSESERKKEKEREKEKERGDREDKEGEKVNEKPNRENREWREGMRWGREFSSWHILSAQQVVWTEAAQALPPKSWRERERERERDEEGVEKESWRELKKAEESWREYTKGSLPSGS